MRVRVTQQTHELSFDGGIVRKRYVSWEEGQPDREWAALTLLAAQAPGLAPQPVARETDGGAPVLVMSHLPGEPLGGTTLSPAQTDALVDAMRRVFAVEIRGSGAPERAWGPAAMRRHVRAILDAPTDLSSCLQPRLVERAVHGAREWLAHDSDQPDLVVDPVAARGDSNLDNVLWDGTSCRLVDFEEFGISDLTYELAEAVEHASSRLARRVDTEGLLAAFELASGQQDRLRRHRVLLATFWLSKLLPGNGGFTRNPAGSTEDQAARVLDLLGT